MVQLIDADIKTRASWSPRARSRSQSQQISETLPVQGVDLVGPLPGDLQLTTVYAIGIGTAGKIEKQPVFAPTLSRISPAGSF
jgi:hypothetical protein